MSLSTTQYGYIIDPLVPLTDDNGTTISNGYVRVFMAGTSTPIITYKDFDGATNEETVQLDNSGRTAYPVIGSKGSTYKVCVYDAEHSQETPIKTIDKVVPIGASVNATNVVQGLNDAEGSGWINATVTGGDTMKMKLDASGVSDNKDTVAKVVAAKNNFIVPLVSKDGTAADAKIPLEKLTDDVIFNATTSSLPSASDVYEAAAGRLDPVIFLNTSNIVSLVVILRLNKFDNAGDTKRMVFSSTEYDNKFYEIKYESQDGGDTWSSDITTHDTAIIEGDDLNTPPDGTKVLAAYNEGKIPIIKILTSIGKYMVYTMTYADTYGTKYRRLYFKSSLAKNGTEYALMYVSSDGGTTFTATISERKYTPREAIAGDYDSTGLTEYNTGDLVFHEDGYGVNGLFRCNDDEVSGSWIASKWTSTTVAAELKRLASLI